MMLVGARATFSAAHELPQHEGVHGHSYEVWAYTKEPCNVEDLQAELEVICAGLDHRMLNGILSDPTMESIARYIAGKMPKVQKVVVCRPVEGLACEWWKPGTVM